jgi:hypothetical protein
VSFVRIATKRPISLAMNVNIRNAIVEGGVFAQPARLSTAALGRLIGQSHTGFHRDLVYARTNSNW